MGGKIYFDDKSNNARHDNNTCMRIYNLEVVSTHFARKGDSLNRNQLSFVSRGEQ